MKPCIFLIITLLLTDFSYASSLDSCLQNADNVDFATARCIGIEVEHQNILLNTVYHHLMSKAKNPTVIQSLRNAERSWIQFRDTSCDVEKALRGNGTLTAVIYQQCLLDMTKQRISRLDQYLNDPDIDNP